MVQGCCESKTTKIVVGSTIVFASVALAVYLAKINKASMTNPLLHPDHSLKLKVRKLFEAGQPTSGKPVWGSDWDAFTEYLLEKDKTVGQAFKQRFERIQINVNHQHGVVHEIGGMPVWHNVNFGQKHTENRVFSTLESLSQTPYDQLFANAKSSLTLQWGAVHAICGLFGVGFGAVFLAAAANE